MATAHGGTLRVGEAGTAGVAGGQVEAGVPRGRAPCRGPACRQAPVKPLLPLEGGVIRIDLDRFAWLVGIDSPVVIGRGDALVTADVAPFSTEAGRLDRPPRAG